MAVDTVVRSRRAILMGAIGAVAATVGSALGRPAEVRAGVDGDVVIGVMNTSPTPTQIENSSIEGAALIGHGYDQTGSGLKGYGPSSGVRGESPGAGVYGKTTTGRGVMAEASNGGIGLWAQTDGSALPGIVARGMSKGVQVIVGPNNSFPTHPANVGVYAQTNIDPNPGFIAIKGVSNQGIGVQGTSSAAEGVAGSSDETGVRGISTYSSPTNDFDVPSHNTGVIGLAGGLEDLLPDNTDETGVYGFADLSPVSTGVWGDSGQGFGVFGSGDVGVGGSGFLGVYGVANGAGASGVLGRGGPGETGVYGFAGAGAPPAPTPNVAVQAKAETASEIALNVIGRAKFSQSGRTSIATNKSSIVITKSGVSTASYIIATLQTKRTGIYVQSVVPAAGKFTIYLNKVVPGTTYVGWFVVN